MLQMINVDINDQFFGQVMYLVPRLIFSRKQVNLHFLINVSLLTHVSCRHLATLHTQLLMQILATTIFRFIKLEEY